MVVCTSVADESKALYPMEAASFRVRSRTRKKQIRSRSEGDLV